MSACGFCGMSFDPDAASPVCARCPLTGPGSCGKIRCPRCGWESPRVPRLLQRFLDWRRGRDAKGR